MPQNTILCARCRALIQPVVSVPLPLTSTKQMQVFALGSYKDPLKSLILAKGRGVILASRQLGDLIWYETVLAYQQFDIIVPIPLHWTRYAFRGYNQAQVIAERIAHFSGKPVMQLLIRNRRTQFQSVFNKKGREQNIDGVFSLREDKNNLYAYKKILLVDDLMTTGATLKEAGRALLVLKPTSIKAVVAART